MTQKSAFPNLELTQELTTVLNRYNAENASNTPDFILAEYMMACLIAFNMATNRRNAWYGREPKEVNNGTSTN